MPECEGDLRPPGNPDAKFAPPCGVEGGAFLAQALAIVKGLDTVIDVLGPNVEDTTEILRAMGAGRYRHHGLSLGLWNPSMGACVLDVLRECLREAYTDEVHRAWIEFWDAAARDVHAGVVRFEMMQERRRRRGIGAQSA